MCNVIMGKAFCDPRKYAFLLLVTNMYEKKLFEQINFNNCSCNKLSHGISRMKNYNTEKKAEQNLTPQKIFHNKKVKTVRG